MQVHTCMLTTATHPSWRRGECRRGEAALTQNSLGTPHEGVAREDDAVLPAQGARAGALARAGPEGHYPAAYGVRGDVQGGAEFPRRAGGVG
eukprot:9486837-Pyramimonas_sp.AAC.1